VALKEAKGNSEKEKGKAQQEVAIIVARWLIGCAIAIRQVRSRLIKPLRLLRVPKFLRKRSSRIFAREERMARMVLMKDVAVYRKRSRITDPKSKESVTLWI
jgi:hypothetical protein